MAELAGAHVTDASGNLLTDVSAAYITDTNIAVTLNPDGVLYAASMSPAGGNPLAGIQDLISDVADVWEWISGLIDGSLTMQAIRNMQNDLNAFMYEDSPSVFDGHDPIYPQINLSANGIIDNISIPPAGGLTEEEHGQLMGLVNTNNDDVANAVWHATSPVATLDGMVASLQRGEVVDNAVSALLFLAGYKGIPLPNTQYYSLVTASPYQYTYLNAQWAQIESIGLPAEPDFSQWVDGDSVYSFMARTQPLYGWQNIGPTGTVHPQVAWFPLGGMLTGCWIRTTFDAPDVPQNIANIFNQTVTITGGNTPLWPGLANVTLGEAVALADQAVIEGPMHGVLVAVTTPPTRTGRYTVGGEVYDYNVGMISFDTDNGYLEPWQYLGFRTAIFVPKAIEQASHAYLRVLAGAEGTIRPWTKTAS